MEDKTWVIYKHTSPSGKSYIGLTSKKPEVRWQNGTGYDPETQIRQAIYKYGWDAFSHEILESDITSLEEANAREKYWIQFYDSFRHGYNMTEGGDSINPDSVKKKPLICYETGEIFETASEAGEAYNIDRSSIARACRLGIKSKGLHFVYLEDYGPEWEPPKSKKLNNSRSIHVLCKETNEEFPSLREASRKMNITPSLISRCCNGILDSTHGYHFEFIQRNEE